MAKEIPKFLYEKLIKQYGEEITLKIIDGYSKKRKVTIRANLLKTNGKKVEDELIKNKIEYKKVLWSKEAFIIENASKKQIEELSLYKNGEIYLQSLSSMIPAIVVNPKANENILDMAAAPGGKTTQMAAMSQNSSFITACEKNKVRAQRLKYNIEKQGANKVNVLVQNALDLSPFFSFDKILLDSPCSGSGTIYLEDEKLEKNFTNDLINRSVKLQSQLLKKAISILKPGQEMVYSTCSILEEENEKQILLKNNIEIVQIDKKEFTNIPLLPTSINGVLCVCPNELYEGFFIAKLRRK